MYIVFRRRSNQLAKGSFLISLSERMSRILQGTFRKGFQVLKPYEKNLKIINVMAIPFSTDFSSQNFCNVSFVHELRLVMPLRHICLFIYFVA
jgi:hypothetical protein